MVSTLEIQTALKAKGFNPGTLDGIMGPKTEAAIIAFRKSIGLNERTYLGPMTLEALLGRPATQRETPWLNEIGRFLGVHEVYDNAKLKAWLKSDGATLGDPAKLPWCGDAVQTAIRLALKTEPLPRNPYYATNWLDFGEKSGMVYGAVAVFSRNGGGHVAFVIGYDPKRKRLRVRGGNQSNRICDAWLDESRCLGYRWPVSYTGPKHPVPLMDSTGAVISRNEA
jgi:uncharacterized protein (TIGR02594 family)